MGAHRESCPESVFFSGQLLMRLAALVQIPSHQLDDRQQLS